MRFRKTGLILIFLRFFTTEAQTEFAGIKEYMKTFPTYPFSDASPIPMAAPVYPYFRFDGFAQKSVNKQWKIVELENNYIRLLILPEIGGKIWAAIEKSTGKSFLYYNHSVKFRDIAMRGPWTSGGLEANYGIIGHTPNCATPVDYFTRKNTDGSVSCFIGTLDLLSRSYWCVEINLPKDKAFFTTSSFWYNTTPLQQPYYHWMNAGLRASSDLEFIYPGNKFLGHNGEHGDWPTNKANGKLISWYKNNDFGGYKSYHVFGKYDEFTGAYWHNDDFGMVRYGSHDDKPGKKIWIWGLSRQGMIWEKLLTDTDGQYVELQSGRLFNQNSEKSSLTPFTHRSFAPYGTDTWKEYWYPVLGTKGFVYANPYGALNIRRENGWVKINFSPAQPTNDSLRIRYDDQIIYRRLLRAQPLQVFSDSIQFAVGIDSLQFELGDHLLVYKENSAGDTLSRPVDAPADFNWESSYGFYVKGREAADMKNYSEAENEFSKALFKDPNFLPALVGQAEIMYRDMRYSEALALSKKALSINTEDAGANFIYGLVNAKLGFETDARDGFDIASMDPAYRSASCTELTKIYLRNQEFDKAMDYTRKALIANPLNVEALQLQSVLYRLLRQKNNANEVLQRLSDLDPLNHFVSFEKYLWLPEKNNMDSFLLGIKTELPSEIILETAIWYYKLGLRDESLKVFTAGPSSAEIQIWTDYLLDKPFEYKTVDPVRSFPFRSETAEVLQHMLSVSPHWFLSYQLALIYKDKGNIEKSRELVSAALDTPEFAPFYAFRYSLYTANDSVLMLHDLLRAIAIDSQWRYQKLLAEYYILHHRYPDALQVAGDFYEKHPDQYIMGMLYAKTLLLNHDYSKCDVLLTNINIIPFEGATAGRDLYRETKLMQAVAQMSKHSYSHAIIFIDQADEWPENIGVGKPYATGTDDRLEQWMRYLCYKNLHENNKADSALNKIVRFFPLTDNTVSNSITENALISAWAFNRIGDSTSSVKYLTVNGDTGIAKERQEWINKVYFSNKDQPISLDAEESNIRIIRKLLSL